MAMRGVKDTAGYAPSLAKTALSVTSFAIKNPLTTVGIIGGGAYAYKSLSSGGFGESPTLSGSRVSANYDQQSIAAERMNSGIAPIGQVGPVTSMMGPGQARFEHSTEGLVNGLHRGRHG